MSTDLLSIEFIKVKLNTIISHQLDAPQHEVVPEARLEDFGMDSLANVELILACEEAFDVDISDEMVKGIATVGDVHALAERLFTERMETRAKSLSECRESVAQLRAERDALRTQRDEVTARSYGDDAYIIELEALLARLLAAAEAVRAAEPGREPWDELCNAIDEAKKAKRA